MIEIWKPIKDYEQTYEVSSMGRIRRRSDGKVLALAMHPTGYLLCTLAKNGTQTSVRVHRIVAEAFIPKVPGKDIVNHKDEVKHHNWVSNLEWVDVSENLHYGKAIERMVNSRKPDAATSKKAVDQLDKDGNYIRTFQSVGDALDSLGKNRYHNSHIQRCCQKPHTSYMGYRWRYSKN